jgi:hypothetical protein
MSFCTLRARRAWLLAGKQREVKKKSGQCEYAVSRPWHEEESAQSGINESAKLWSVAHVRATHAVLTRAGSLLAASSAFDIPVCG